MQVFGRTDPVTWMEVVHSAICPVCATIIVIFFIRALLNPKLK